jgi:hypothetical protein
MSHHVCSARRAQLLSEQALNKQESVKSRLGQGDVGGDIAESDSSKYLLEDSIVFIEVKKLSSA